MLEPTRGPPGPSERSVEKLARLVGRDRALYILNLSLIRDEPYIRIDVGASAGARCSLVYRFVPGVLDEGGERLTLVGVCVVGVGELPEPLRQIPADDILYYRSEGGIWVVIIDEPELERALQLARRVCGESTVEGYATASSLEEVC